ncbi:MAG: Na/Pi cotransporter family protein [Anaerovoracaceae bacterium]
MFITVFLLLGGAGLLLYGIEIMKDSLEWVSEGRSQRLIEASGSSTIKNILAGIVVTGINQKSSATTIMVVGMVNAGMVSLTQAAAVIMGANIGTTITAQLLAFRLEYFAPSIVGVAAVFWKYAKTKRIQYTAEIFIGFGILFIGMVFLEQGLISFDVDAAQEYLAAFSRPYSMEYLVLIVIGFVATTAVRSSSLLTGVMIAMSAQSLLTIEMGIPLILGINVGKCMTAIIDSRSAGRTAKRAAVIHLLFNTIGAILVAVFFQTLFADLTRFLAVEDVPRQIANAHTIFNLGTALLCAPLVNLLVIASDKLVPVKKDQEHRQDNLDVRMLETPGLALAQTYNEIIALAKMSFESYEISFQCVRQPDEKYLDKIREQEDQILGIEKDIEIYLVKLAQKQNNTKQQHEMLNLMLGVISDIERISDLSVIIAELALYKRENSILFSLQADREMEEFHEQLTQIVNDVTEALEKRDGVLANSIFPAEIKIKAMEKVLRDNHIDRLSEGICHPGSGVLFIDIINSMEHVAQHLRKIGYFVVEAAKH